MAVQIKDYNNLNDDKSKSVSKNVVFSWGFWLLTAVFILLLVRGFFGVCQNDEAFYIAQVQKLWLGDRLILDNWTGTQFYSPLLLPYYALFRIFNHTSDGAILFFRIVYTTLAYLAGITVYLVLRTQCGNAASLCSALIVLLYSRANIWGMSYYNVCFISAATGMTLLIYSDCFSARKYIAAGFLLSWATLCMPYMAVLAAASFLVAILCKRKNDALYFLLGIAISTVLYCVFLIPKEPVPSLLENFAFIFNGGEPIGKKLERYYFLYLDRRIIATSFAVCIFDVVLKAVKKNSLRELLRIVYFAFAVLRIVAMMRTVKTDTCNLVLYRVVIFLFPVIVATVVDGVECRNVLLFLSGLLITFCVSLCSNTGQDAMTIGFAVSTISIVLSLETWLEASHLGKPARVAKRISAAVMCIAILASMSLNRFPGVYRDAPIPELNTKLEVGPAKGLYTTAGHAAQYNDILGVVQKICKEHPDASVLVTRCLPWVYLCGNNQIATPNVWKTMLEDNTVLQWYERNPDRAANLVFVLGPQAGAWDRTDFNPQENHDNPNEQEFSGELWNLIQEKAECIYSDANIACYYSEDGLRSAQ